jgi:hypothetical protein
VHGTVDTTGIGMPLDTFGQHAQGLAEGVNLGG